MWEGELTMFTQPYILFLITIGRQVNIPFQLFVRVSEDDLNTSDEDEANLRSNKTLTLIYLIVTVGLGRWCTKIYWRSTEVQNQRIRPHERETAVKVCLCRSVDVFRGQLMCHHILQFWCRYTHNHYAMPSSAVMCDVVRCLIECEDADDMVATYNKICANMEVRIPYCEKR